MAISGFIIQFPMFSLSLAGDNSFLVAVHRVERSDALTNTWMLMAHRGDDFNGCRSAY
jgi:hypothetical protein